MTRLRPSVALIATVVVALTVALPAQQATFRSSSQTVAIYATVVDSDSHLVTDLEQKHFEVYDNGVLKPLTTFKSDVQPITVVVMLDTSGSMTLDLDLLKQAAEQFVLRLLPEDRAPHRQLQRQDHHQPALHGRPRRARPHPSRGHPVRQSDIPVGRDRREHVRAGQSEPGAAWCSCSPTARTTSSQRMKSKRRAQSGGERGLHDLRDRQADERTGPSRRTPTATCRR